MGISYRIIPVQIDSLEVSVGVGSVTGVPTLALTVSIDSDAVIPMFDREVAVTGERKALVTVECNVVVSSESEPDIAEVLTGSTSLNAPSGSKVWNVGDST